jgi:hypothetical protein
MWICDICILSKDARDTNLSWEQGRWEQQALKLREQLWPPTQDVFATIP